MDITELRSFCEAARLNSISRAAEHLGLGQPTVSTHIKKLETELETTLFDRVRRPLQLTTAGVALYEAVAPLVGKLDGLAQELKKSEIAATISVVATPDIVNHKLLTLVRDFCETHSEVRFVLLSRRRLEAMELVRSGEADFAVVPAPEESLPLELQFTFTYDRVLVTPLGHPLLKLENVSLEEIAAYPLVLMGPHTFTRGMLEDAFRRKGIPYHVSLELDSTDMIKRYVAWGMGVGVGPELAIEPGDEKQIGVVSLAHLLPQVRAGGITLKGRYLPQPVREFISVVARAWQQPHHIPGPRASIARHG